MEIIKETLDLLECGMGWGVAAGMQIHKEKISPASLTFQNHVY